MKKLLGITLTLTLALLTVDCSSGSSGSGSVIRPQTQTNAPIRKMELDQIRVGDNFIKAQAVLGEPTVKSSNPSGTTATWWFTPADSKDAYWTLKDAPHKTEGVKFIKLTVDPKGKITAKDFEI